MGFLRTLFWIVITVIVVVFSVRNWVPVTISLFGDIQADVKLPVLLLIAFLIGFVPLYIWHRFVLWGRARRGATPERTPLAPTVAPPTVVQSAPQSEYPSPLSPAPTAQPAPDPFRGD